MQIALPKKVEFQKGDQANQGNIIIEPCFPGYGITIGNSLRRVMLSSLPGAAPVGVKIKGVDHEFMTLPHLKEDVLEFILNLKQLRLEVHSDETEKLELAVHGKKIIKASDIKKNSNIEIINSDLVLGEITDMAGSVEAEIFTRRGMGYETLESREEKSSEIGYIEMDSIFSPVYSVGIKVENVRVGKMTNWEKLVLDIKTDGTISPKEAFEKSVEILINQFGALMKGGEKKKEEKEKDKKEEPKKEKAEEEKEDTEEKRVEEKKKRGRPKKVES